MGVGIKGFGGTGGGPGPKLQGLTALPPAAVAAKNIFEGPSISSFDTWDPANKAARIVLSNGDLSASTSGAHFPINGGTSVLFVSSGKYYWEVTCVAVFTAIGVANTDWNLDFQGSGQRNYYSFDGVLRSDLSTNFGDSYTAADVISVALDMDNGQVWMAKNGVWQGSGSPDPDTLTDPAATGLTDSWGASYWLETIPNPPQVTANFGDTPFIHTVPDGFIAGFGT